MVDEFLRKLKIKGYAKNTITLYRRVLRSFCYFNKDSIHNYQQKILVNSVQTRICYLCALRNFLKEHFPKLVKEIIIPKEEKLLPRNIPDQVEIRQILQEPDILSFDGIRDKAILELLYSTGIRRSELLNLNIADLDSQRLIRINQGKNRKDRIIPISDQAYLWLKKYVFKVRINAKTNYVFLNQKGQKLGTNSLDRIIKKYSQYSAHKYRHAYATHLLQNGMKETSLQKLLGHSLIQTTQIYMKVTIRDLQTAYNKYHQRDKWQ